MKVNDIMMKIFQKRLGYTNDEFELFKSNPRNIEREV